MRRVKHRTQIYIEDDRFKVLADLARKQNISISEIIRLAIRNFLAEIAVFKKDKEHFLLKIAGLCRGSREDGSLYHDEHLYGGEL